VPNLHPTGTPKQVVDYSGPAHRRQHRQAAGTCCRLVVAASIACPSHRSSFGVRFWCENHSKHAAAVVLAMFAMASFEISSRQQRRFAGAWGYGIGAGTTMLATLLVTAFALFGTLRPSPWYAPQVLIPLLGIILGNVMNGVSVSLNALSTAIIREQPAIEGRLALGTDRHTALKPLQRSALRNGMIPIINQMSAAGVITLPGMTRTIRRESRRGE
jgi:ABC-type iron transport system FetAB permease component